MLPELPHTLALLFLLIRSHFRPSFAAIEDWRLTVSRGNFFFFSLICGEGGESPQGVKSASSFHLHAHRAMGNPKHAKVLTHEEIWDDSALVRSWDEAIEEYQVRYPQ